MPSISLVLGATTAAIVAVVCLSIGNAAAHSCIHDDLMSRLDDVDHPEPEPYDGDVVLPEYIPGDQINNERARRLEATYEPIRIRLVTDKLSSDPGYMCTTKGATVRHAIIPSSGSATKTCSEADVLTAEKKDYLINVVLSEAVSFLTQALRVLPMTSPNKVRPRNYYCDFFYVDCCAEDPNSANTFMPPEAISPGYSATDFVLFVTARPTTGSTIAWALTCDENSPNGRPTAGHANFGPNQLSTDPAVRHNQVATAIHEIMHAMAFHEGKFSQFVFPGTNTRRTGTVVTYNERGSSRIKKINTPKVLEKLKEHFAQSDCDAWQTPGGELEDDGGAGTAGSHWEKRVFMNEVMTGSVNANWPAVVSPITLALFEDSGWYTVDYDMADRLHWGAGEGCSFASEYCSTWSSQYFCSVPDERGCSPSRLFKAQCNVDNLGGNLPGNEAYFPGEPTKGGRQQFPDYCPYYEVKYASDDCRTTTNAPAYAFYGEKRGASSRCFDGSFAYEPSVRQNSAYSDPHVGCLDTTCDSTQLLIVRLKDPVGPFFDLSCPREGGALDVGPPTSNKFVGIVNCPPSALLCTGNPCDNNYCNGHGTCRESDGTCQCVTGYYGADGSTTACDRVTCPKLAYQTKECGAFGTCISEVGVANAGTCQCQAKYRGDACEEEGCPFGKHKTTTECDGAGSCADGVCHCNAGFIGDSCSQTECPKNAANQTCSNNGVCDETHGYCTCSHTEDVVDGELRTVQYYSGPACATNNQAGDDKRFPRMMFVSEVAANGTNTSSPVGGNGKYQPTVMGLVAQEYSYFSFVVDSIAYPVTLTMTHDGSADPQLVACYETQCAAPTLSNAAFHVTDVVGNVKKIQFTPASRDTVFASAYNQLGVMLVGMVSESSTSVTVSLERDACAVLECVHGTCQEGACKCDRPSVFGSSGQGSWSGSLCDQPDCPGTPDCGDFRGSCVVDTSVAFSEQFPTCRCNTGFSGDACGDVDTAGFTQVNVTQPSSLAKSQQVGTNRTYFFELPANAGLLVQLRSLSPGADPVMLGQPGRVPSLVRDVNTAFDELAWTQNAPNHTISVARTQAGIYFVTVLNGRYATEQLDYTIDFEVVSGSDCPDGLNNCNGHGTCNKVCTCSDGYGGPRCSVPVPSVVSSPSAVTTMQLGIGEWRYFVYKSSDNTREVEVKLTGSAVRSNPLVSVAVSTLKRSDPLRLVAGSSALFDYDGFTSRASSQTVKINKRGGAFYYIGVHNTRNAASPLEVSLSVQGHTSHTFTRTDCLSSIAAQTECGVELCSGRGTYATDENGNPFCLCQSGWAADAYCNSPRFASFSNLLEAAQRIGFLCNLCDFELSMKGDELQVYKIPQPLQKSTGLALSVQSANASALGNPSLLVSQYLPRSIVDFSFISSSNSANESLSLATQSPTGRYWVAVYANTKNSYSVQATRQRQPGTTVLTSAFFKELWAWASGTTLGTVTSIVGIAVLLCLCCGCAWQVCSSGGTGVKKRLKGQMGDLQRGVAHMREAASVRFLNQASRRHNPGQADASRNLNLELQAISLEMASSRRSRNEAAMAAQSPGGMVGAGGGTPAQYSPVVPAGYQGQPAVASPSYPMPQASAQPAYPSPTPAHAQPSYPSPAMAVGGGGGYPPQAGGYPQQAAAVGGYPAPQAAGYPPAQGGGGYPPQGGGYPPQAQPQSGGYAP